ncbi:YfiM family protein [Sphingomonas sp. XMGL2]|uniref:YfiM family protein n=2 Tax=Sphingomonas quercus TaxID=2842451 RepID=A0ABS6BJ23_9SPHN|nr:YfiM family protein [Sphingomonas quercus]
MTVINVKKMTEVGTRGFHFQNEGWFGKSTLNLGVDKLAHAFNTYAISDILYARLRRKTDAPSAAVTAAVLASGLQIYSEFFDAVKKSSGFSVQDVAFNTAGAALSALRNSVPGMRDKLDFRLLFIPNSDIYTFMGGEHYEQERFLLALQLSGFEAFKHTPLRFVELHAGYYGKDFSGPDRDAGKIPQRKPFIGIGLNLQELLFPHPRSRAAKIGRGALDYFQVPYTAVHID